MDALELQLALAQATGLSASQLRDAYRHLSPTAAAPALGAIVGQPLQRLLAAGLSNVASGILHAPNLCQIASDRAWVQGQQITLIDCLSSAYPTLLAQAADAPPLLYVRGDASCLSSPQLAIVGARRPTDAGRRTARQFAASLAQAGLTITSGLAVGIDAAAHEGALTTGRTIAVLGSGLDQIYPPEHAQLAERIAARGALVSEFARGCPPLKRNFPRRNRIISGLAIGTLVVEAARYSGSLITARLAAEQGREVFAIPGSIHNPMAHGCHALLRAGANLVENAPEVLEDLKFCQPLQTVISSPGQLWEDSLATDLLDKEHKILLDALGFEPTSIDELVQRCGFPSQSVASMLLILELEGMVALQTDGRYMRLPA